jgi:hypothetical protein
VKENVRERGERANVADRGLFLAEAEQTTGITKQQVSRWAKRLEDRQAHREALFGAVYRKAMGLRGQTDQRGALRRAIRLRDWPGQMFRATASGCDPTAPYVREGASP